MGKQKNETISSREKYISWSDETTKFMLEWYINAQKDKPACLKWKQQHHLQCANALNDKFGIGATTAQVDRHFRLFKERWKLIKKAMGRSGYGFDAASSKFNIDKSEKSPSKLGSAKYNYLTRPIKFFHLLEELFGESTHADGSLAMDHSTIDDASDSDESGDVIEIENCASAGEYDSDTIAHSSQIEGTGSSVKRKHVKSPAKKPLKNKKQHARVSDDAVAESIVSLAHALKSTVPTPPMQQMANVDPNANLWQRIEDIPFSARDKLELAAFLSRKEQDHFRSFLNCASKQTFDTWVGDYFAAKYDGNAYNGGADAM